MGDPSKGAASSARRGAAPNMSHSYLGLRRFAESKTFERHRYEDIWRFPVEIEHGHSPAARDYGTRRPFRGRIRLSMAGREYRRMQGLRGTRV